MLGRFGEAVVAHGRVPDALSDDMGNYQYTARFETRAGADEFVTYVHERERETDAG